MEVHHVYGPNCFGRRGATLALSFQRNRNKKKSEWEKRVTVDWMRPCGLRLWSTSIADLGMHWKHMLLRPGWGVACRRICPTDGSDRKKKKKKGKALRKLMPAMNSYPHPYCHSSKMRKSINVTEKGSCQKGEGGGEAIPVALVGWFCAAYIWSTSPVPVAKSLSFSPRNDTTAYIKQTLGLTLWLQKRSRMPQSTDVEVAHTLVNTSAMKFTLQAVGG